MAKNMEFLCEMWIFSAEEYMAFLNRNGVDCFGVRIIYRNRTAIYADEQKYLQLAINDSKFSEAEKQLIKLLEQEEKMVDKYIEAIAKIGNNFGQPEELSQYNDEEE